MSNFNLDIKNENKQYLDEKELFILFYLFKNKRISTMWSNVFVPNPRKILIKPDTTPENLWERINYRGQSVIVLNYLLNLGKTLDEKGFSIYCNADFALVEGGFLADDFHEEMYGYLELSEEERNKDTILNKEQKDFLEDVILGKLDLSDIQTSVMFTKLANPPVECYRECVLNKKADKDFIDLVNKLVTDYDGGIWKTTDVEQFLKIWYQSNKRLVISKEEGIFYEDNQKKLSRLIFENVDIQLVIKNTEKLEDYLNNYFNLYKNDQIKGLSRKGLTKSFFSVGYSEMIDKKYYGYKRQKNILVKHIESTYEEYQRKDLEITNPYIEPEYIGDDKTGTVKITPVEENKERDSFLYVHTMIALEKEGFLTIDKYSYGTKEMFDLYDRGFLFEIILNSIPEERHILSEVFFDTEKSILRIKDSEIKVQKFNDQYHTLRIVFTEPSKEWFFSEIAEKYDNAKRLSDKKFYNAIYQINQKLKTVGITDFFISTRQSVQINKRHLS